MVLYAGANSLLVCIMLSHSQIESLLVEISNSLYERDCSPMLRRTIHDGDRLYAESSWVESSEERYRINHSLQRLRYSHSWLALNVS